jgi:hypothetical protein
MAADEQAVPHGSMELPIPVPMNMEVDDFMRLYAAACLASKGVTGWLSEKTQTREGRRIEIRVAKAAAGKHHAFYFDVTIRERHSMPAVVLVPSGEEIAKLRERMKELPERGCFLCKWLLELGPKGELTKTDAFDLLGKVKHLWLEGIAEYRVACSQCRNLLPAHSGFESRDLAVCTPCEAILRVTDAIHKAQQAAKSAPLEPQAVYAAVHFPNR